MSTTLASLRTSIVDAIQLADPGLENVYEDDPREEFGFLEKLRKGNAVRAWLIADFNPSAVAVIDSSDYTAIATILGLWPVKDGAKVEAQDTAQLVVRRLRDIDYNRSAVVAGIDVIQVAGRFACYQVTISAEFYALQTVS